MVMMLRRLFSTDQGTVGDLIAAGARVCRILELPWRGNRPNLSRIPPGRYRVSYMARSASGRYRDVYQVHDVPGRGGVLFHTGNLAGDTARGWRTDSRGCLLPFLRLGTLDGQRAGLVSRGAMNRLHAATGRQDFTLEVIDDGVA